MLLDIFRKTHARCIGDDSLHLSITVVEEMRQTMQGNGGVVGLHIAEYEHDAVISRLHPYVGNLNILFMMSENGNEKSR